MKKFMIFLLMAFLYLGTCQARSESAHPNDANKKLLSWVTPTPSQSFLARSVEADATFRFSPNGNYYIGVDATESIKLNVLSNDFGATQYKWLRNGAEIGTSEANTGDGTSEFTIPAGLPEGTHIIRCVAVKGDESVLSTDSLKVVVSAAQHDVTVNIIGLNEACENYPVTLTAQISANQLSGFTYTWKVDGEVPASYPYNGQTFVFTPSELFANSQNQVHEFSVEVSYAGCTQELSPIHLFTVIPTPTVAITVPDTVCANVDPVYTATVDGLVPEHYQWYLKKSDGQDTLLATTPLNTYTRPIADGEDSIGVKATYSNTVCNSEISWVKIPGTYTITPKSENLTLTISPVYDAHKDTMCVGEQVTFQVQDNNNTTILGTPTYTWSVNGLAGEEVTGNSYVAVFEAAGNYEVTVNATYANYPCNDVVVAKDTVTIMTAPAIAVTGENVICAGDSATLVATDGFQTYTWTGVGVPVDNTTKSIKVVAGTYTVSGITEYGCASEEAEEITVTQFGGDLQVTATEYQVCPGTVVAINANLSGWTNENISYKWSDDANATGSLREITATKDSTITVTAYAGVNENDTACKMSQVITINVVNEVMPQITLNPNTDQTICLNDQFKVKINEPAGSTYAGLYNWYYDGVEIHGQHLDSITVTMVEAGDHYFTAKRANYVCGLDTMSAPVNVTVNELPALVVTGNNQICQADTAIMAATVIAGATYNWVGPDANAANVHDSAFKTTIPGVYSVSAEKGGCVTAPAMFTITQFGGDLHVYASEVQVCPGTAVALTANLEGYNNQNIAYEWTYNNAVIDSNATTVVVPVRESGKDSVVYTVTATAVGVDTLQCQMTADIAIYIYDTAVVPLKVTVGDDKICQGGQVYAVAKPKNNAVVDFYTWYIDGVEVPGQNLDSIVVNLIEPGTYYFSAKPANQNCVDQAATIADKSVQVYEIPELIITGNSVVCNGDTAKMVVTPSTTDEFEYTWAPSENIVDVQDSMMKTLTSGIYSVTAKGECQATADVVVTVFGANLLVSADMSEICAGDYVMINADLNGFNNQNITYEWTASVGNAPQGGSIVTVNPTETTKYVVTAHGGNCSLKDSITITVHERPATPTVQRYNTLYDICQGDQASFRAQPRNLSYTYVWTLNGIEIASEGRPTISLNLDEPGVYNIGAKVINEFGCVSEAVSEGTYFAQVSVHAIPELTITGNSVVCNGDTAILTVHASNTGDTYIYNWTPAANILSGSNDTTIKTLVAGVYNVTASHQLSGCTATAQVTVSTFGGNLLVSADRTQICPEESVVLTATLNGFNNENISYAWTQVGAGNVGQGSIITVEPDATTKYAVTASAGATCTMTDTIEITVHPRPERATVARYDNTPYNICQGDQASFRAQPRNLANTYVWTLNGVEIADEGRPTITLNLDEPGVYNIGAKIINEFGCVSQTVSEGTIDAQVRVHAIPELTISGNNVVCNGDTAILTVTASNTGDQYTYSWTPEDNIASGSNTATIKTVNDGVYTVTAVNAISGCTATAQVTVGLLGANLLVSADKVETCAGDYVIINAGLNGFNNENITYEWTASVGNAPEGGSIVTVNPTETTKYVVTAHAGNCSMMDSVTITVHPLPATVNVTSDATVCQGDQITLTATAEDTQVPTSPAVSYIWFENGVEMEGENQNIITVNMDVAGTYKFTAKAVSQFGCVSAIVGTPAVITVDSTPVVTILGEHFYTVNANNPAILTANVIPAGTYTYAWNAGNSITSKIDTVTEYGVYQVTVTSANGCVAVSEPFTVSAVVDLQVNIVGVNAACINDTVILSAVVDYDLEGHTYQWYVNGNPVVGATEAHYGFRAQDLYDSTGVYANDIRVEINRGGGCAPVMSPVHHFLITPAPLAVVIAPEKSCKGTDVVLRAQVYEIGGDAQYQYIWYKNTVNDTFEVVDYIDTIIIPAAEVEGNTYAVQAIFQDIACSSPVSEFVALPLYPEPQPISLTVDPSQLCTAGQAAFTVEDNNSEEEFGAVTYDWYVNGIHAPGVHGNYFTGNFNYNGDFQVYVTATYADYPCEVISTNDTTIHVNMHPTVQITGDPIICEDNNIVLYANLNDTVGSMDYTYDWRLYNYSLGNNSLDLGRISIPLPDSPDFMEDNVWSSAMLGNTPNLTASTSLLNSLIGTGEFTAQDYPYIFTVVVTSPEGCRTVSEPYYVYVGEHPRVAVTVDYDTVCAEGAITAVAHLADYNMDNLTYQWQVRTKRTNRPYWRDADWQNIRYATEPVLHHVPGTTSQYRLIVTQTTTGCEAISDTLEIDVIVPPHIDHIVAINANSDYPFTSVCEGAQLEITAKVAVLDANNEPTGEYYVDTLHNYVWRLNGIDLNDIHGAYFSAQAGIYDSDPVDYVYSAYMVYDIPGCELIEVSSDTIHVKRNPIVTIDGNPNVCFFGPTVENVVLTAWVDGVVDLDATYTWFESGQLRPNPAGFDNKYKEMWRPTYDNPYVFTVEVTNGDGCTTISDPFYVNVYEKPYVNITGDANAICKTGEVTLQANLNNYNDPMLTFQWYRNEVNNINLIEGAVHEIQTFEPTRTTNYIVKVTHLMDYNTQYCVAYDTFKVQVNDIPEIVTAVNDLAGVKTICEGRNVTLNVTEIANGVPGGEVYTWYRNGDVVLGVNGPVFVDSPVAVDGEPTQYVYQVSVEQSASGCASEIYTLTDTITVNPNPVIELVTDPIVCNADGNNITLHANITPAINNSGDVQYQWLEDNLQIALTNDPVYSLHRDFRDYPYSFSVRTVNTYGCVSEASTVVYVDSTPNVYITVTEDQICTGGEITLAATLADWNADQLTYQWKDNGHNIDGATSMTYTYNPAVGNHSYTFEVYQITSGCLGVSKTALDVTVVDDPVVTSIVNNIPVENAVCDGYQVNLAAVVTGGVRGGEVYTWYRNGAVIEGAVDSIYTEVVSALNNEPTHYTYAVSVAQSANDCESNVYTMNSFTVNPNPVVVLVTDPIVCVAQNGVNNITLTANVYPEVETGVTYNWFEDNAPLALSTADSTLSLYRPYRDYPYSFSVAIVNQYGCSATSEALVSVDTTPHVFITVSEYSICEGGEITLSASLADWNADQLVFQWYNGNDIIEGATSLTYTYAPVEDNYHYHLYVEQLTSGCTAESNVLDVEVKPVPEIVSVVASDYEFCYGGQISVTATVDVPFSTRTDGIYTWYRNGVLIEGATAATIFDTPGIVDNNIQRYNYSASVIFPEAGCSSDIKFDENTVTVYPNPRVQITGDQHVCEVDSVFLIANVDTTGYGIGNLHYTWYESTQIRDNMAYNLGDRQFFAEYLYARTEPYRFTVDVWRGDAANACVSHSEEFLVYVYTQPVVNITASETEICTNGEVTLTANLNDYNAENITYQWYEVRNRQTVIANGYDFDNNTYSYDTISVPYRYYIPGATSAVYTTSLTDTTVLGVEVFQTNSECSAYDEIKIKVFSTPVVTSIVANSEFDTLVVCDGAPVTISAGIDAYNAAGAVYTWYRNGVVIEGAHNDTFSENVFTTDNHSTPYRYTATVELPASGCVSAMSEMSAVVIVNPAPSTVNITGNNVICQNDSTILTAHSNVDGIFVWSTGDTATSVMVPAGSYNVTVITAEGCQMTSDNFTVEAYGTDLIVTASATNICEGDAVTLYVDQEGWVGNVTYQWDAQAGSSTSSTVDVHPTTTTTYHVTATVVNAAGSCTAEASITINVNPRPAAPRVEVMDNMICAGASIIVYDDNLPQYDQYVWYMNGTEIAGEGQYMLTLNNVPAGLYNFNARVVSDAGCYSELSEDVAGHSTVMVVAAPESVEITGIDNFCDGGFTTLYANVTLHEIPVEGMTQTVTYAWYKDGVAMNNLPNADHITVTAAGSYRVVATVNNICSTESMSYDVFVNETPQVQLTANETTICVGGTTLINAQPTGYNNQGVNYDWSDDQGSLDFHGSAYTFNPTTAGTYTFTVTASQSASGCQATDQITITVNDVPAVPQVHVDNPTVCDGGQVTLTVTNAIDGASYIWKRNGTVILNSYDPTLTESPLAVDGDATNYVYTVVAQLPMSGCTSVASADMIVTVIPAPEVTVAIEGNTTICVGGSTILHANVTPDANYHYQWYKDNILLAGDTNATYTVSELARETSYDFHVVVTANPGCTVEKHAAPITVVADPQVEATISNNIACVGGTATLNVIVDGGVDGVNGLNNYTYEWYRNIPNGNSTLVATTREFTTSANDTAGYYSYRVVVTSEYGCQSESTPVTFSIVPDPVVTISVASGYATTLCDGGSTTLKANVTGGYGEVSYKWYKNGNELIGQTYETLVLDALHYGDNDNYVVEVIQSGVGCGSFATININDIVTVNPNYTVNITGFGNVCEGGTLTLTANVNGVIEGDVLSYQWYKVTNGVAVAIDGANEDQYSTSDLLLGASYDYYVVVNSTIVGCSMVSNTVTSNVVSRPSVTINGAHTVCEGGDLALNAAITGGVAGAPYVYTWEWTGAAQGDTTTAVATFIPNVAANDAATPYYFTVTISRADNTGCTATSAAHEVNVLAAPTVSITADNYYVCPTGEVTFTAHVAPVGSYNYVWTINGQRQADNANTVTASLVSAGTINASVEVSAAGASASCSATAELATAVQVVAAPTVTLVADHNAMCVGGATTLTATVNANNNLGSNFTYEWNVDGSSINGVTNILNQTISEAGVHTYQVKVTQNADLNCASAWSTPVTIQVAEQPVVTLNSLDGLAICEGGSVTLTGVVTNYGNSVNGVTNSNVYGNMSFNWISNGVSSQYVSPVTTAMNQITETLNNVGNYSYQVVVSTSGYNCQPQTSNTQVVNVVSNPSWTEVHVYSSHLLDGCIGDLVTLNAEIQGGAFDYADYTGGHIQWTVTDSLGNTTNVSGGLGGNSYDLPSQAGTYIYTPTFVGNIGSGCQLTNTTDVQAAITIHNLPTAVFTSGDGSSICSNDPSASAELAISFTGVAPFYYEVVDGNGNIVAAASTMTNTVSIYVAPSEQTTYRIVTVADAYCQNNTLTEDAIATVRVNYIEFTETTFIGECDGDWANVYFNMIAGDTHAAFTVTYDNTVVLPATGTNTYSNYINNNTAYVATPHVPGTYDAVLSIDGCDYAITIIVPVSDAASLGGNVPLMEQRWNDVVVVNCNSNTNGGHTFIAFQWYKDGVAIPGATYSNYQEIGGLNGYYSVELTERDINGNYITYRTCEVPFFATTSVKVYPVPANVRQEITIELDLTAEELEGAVLDIYSVTGALISHVTDLAPITKIEGFQAQGTYFGRILTGTNEIKTVKFVIVK